MADARDQRSMLKQCLSDIAYEEAEIQALMDESTQALLQSLTERRRRLLSGIHRDQECVDCLDYLVYQLRRGGLKATPHTAMMRCYPKLREGDSR